MNSTNMIFGFFLISQICIGVLGNLMLFIFYSYTYFIKAPLKKPIELILMHLTLVNSFTIMFKLIPEVMPSFGISHYLDDVGCQVTLYTFRVTRGLSICTTTLLSLFQAITIIPGHSKWALLKSRTSDCIFLPFISFWIINMVIYSHIISTVRATNHNDSVSRIGYSQLYCENTSVGNNYSRVFLSSMVIRDGVFVVLMVGSSLYMVITLYRHHQRVRRVLRAHLSTPSSPEIRATQSITMLVSCFIIFYFLNNFLTFYMFFTPEKMPELDRINGILSSGYPTLCPIVLLRNTKINFQFHHPVSKVKAAFGPRTISSRQR